jgi:molybdopterin-containing oxidoreductase family iron-sulfur binding subunit
MASKGAETMATMVADVGRALSRPVEQRRWGMVIDVRRCIACHACTVACKAENKTPPGVSYNVVVEQEMGTYPTVAHSYLPKPCMQCTKPPCVEVCPVRPVKATNRRPDGVVDINYDLCIGCKLCIPACPYGSRAFDSGEFYTDGTPRVQLYEQATTFEYGREWAREKGKTLPPIGKTRKCHYCVHRLERGALPACVTTCIGQARYFGDLNDPQSMVAQLLADPRAGVLKPELGIGPTTHYLFLQAVAPPVSEFSDVPANHPFHDEIVHLASLGIVGGFPDGTFRPNAFVIRQQMAKILSRATGRHTGAIDNQDSPTFSDVTPDMGVPHPFDYVEECAQAGFFLGNRGKFSPGANITRVQLALVLVRAGGGALQTPPAGYATGFRDVPDYALSAVASAKYNGILDGKTEADFDPYTPATRGHVAKMTSRLLDKIGEPTPSAA